MSNEKQDMEAMHWTNGVDREGVSRIVVSDYAPVALPETRSADETVYR